MALVCPAVGPAAGRVGSAEVNLVACTSAPFAAADGEGNTQPELQGGRFSKPEDAWGENQRSVG